MKFNKALLICSMVIISLLAVGAVSAAEDVSDVAEISDVAVDNGVDEILEDGEAGDNPADNPGDQPETCSTESGTGTGTGTGGFPGMGGNGTGGFDMSSMGGMMDMFSGMMGGGASNTIQSKDVTKYYAKKTTYKVTLLDSSKKAVAGKSIVFTINNKEYVAKTNSKGVATLKLKLKPGKYTIISEFGDTMVKNQIKVKNVLITKNLVKKFKKLGKFKVKVLNSKGKAYAKRTVKISFRGVTTKIKTNKKGIATFKVSKNLKKGKYTIKTIYNGLTRKNKITVK